MALLVTGDNVSAAWVAGLERLLDGGGEAVNLTVAIAAPTTENSAVRSILDAFVADQRRSHPRSIERISTVANTIFPESLYIERLGKDAEDHLYALERRTRDVTHLRNRLGTYFERMVAWPLSNPRNGEQAETFNQLDQAVTRLRRLRDQGVRRGNQFEIGLAAPDDEAIAVPMVLPGRDRQTMGFPCLSHVSLSLQKGVVHMAALYRNHEYIRRSYGNYLGLGRLLRFVAQQSGWPLGELTCISASATVGSGAGFSRRALNELLDACHAAERETS